MNIPSNSLYLNIKQEFFDQIMAGTKKQEFREVKPTTIKRLLQLDKDGHEIEDENGNSRPIHYDAIHFRVGMNKVADEAVVEVKDAYTEVIMGNDNELIEYLTDKKGNLLYEDAQGKLYTPKQLQALDESIPTDAEAKAFFEGVHPAKPVFDEEGNCINGEYWVVQQVVFNLGRILDKNIVSK